MSEHRAPWVVVTGLDGAGKTTLVSRLSDSFEAKKFRLPYHDFVKPALVRSGRGGQYSDVLTDRLIFAADARLTNYLITEWRKAEPLLVSQRGWMDNYVFGAVQGIDWSDTAAFLQTEDLERPSAIIHLIADPWTAYRRIRNDHGDKYETPAFMRRQHLETIRFYEAVEAGHPALMPFAGIPSVLIDTTKVSLDDVLAKAAAFVCSAVSGIQPLTAVGA